MYLIALQMCNFKKKCSALYSSYVIENVGFITFQGHCLIDCTIYKMETQQNMQRMFYACYTMFNISWKSFLLIVRGIVYFKCIRKSPIFVWIFYPRRYFIEIVWVLNIFVNIFITFIFSYLFWLLQFCRFLHLK